MATKTYFCTVSYVKDNTPISASVDESLVNMAILDAQALYVMPALGTKLYDKMSTLIVSGDISKPAYADYKNLLDTYVLECVTHWAMVECIPYIRYKVMNKSVTGQGSDNSTPIDLEELKFLMQQVRGKAEYYTQRLADHLLAHYALYPEYNSPADIDDIVPDTNAYFSGMVLDEPRDVVSRLMGYNRNNHDLNW